MKVMAQDPYGVGGVRPLELAAYLRAQQWQEAEHRPGRFSVWQKPGDDAPVEVLLPLDEGLRDYRTRLAEALHTLTAIEGRPQANILADIQHVADDVVRLVIDDERGEYGTLPIEHGVALVECAYELMLASACHVADPRPVYYARKPPEALEYLRNVRLGPVEQGSFVLAIHAPIRPVLTSPRHAAGDDVPFERRVSEALMRGLAALREAAARAAASGALDPFARAVDAGISANLCEAVVGVYEDAGARHMRACMRWSPMRARAADVPDEVVVAADAVPFIKEAGRLLRESAPRDDFELYGFVVEWRRRKGKRAHLGVVTVAGVVDGELRNIQVDLEENEYEDAITAHQRGRPIRCEGELVREKRSYVLQNPRNFVIE